MSTFADLAGIEWRDKMIAELRAEIKQWKVRDAQWVEKWKAAVDLRDAPVAELAILRPHAEVLERHLVGIVDNWNEFGAEGGLDERMDYAHRYLVEKGLLPGISPGNESAQ